MRFRKTMDCEISLNAEEIVEALREKWPNIGIPEHATLCVTVLDNETMRSMGGEVSREYFYVRWQESAK